MMHHRPECKCKSAIADGQRPKGLRHAGLHIKGYKGMSSAGQASTSRVGYVLSITVLATPRTNGYRHQLALLGRLQIPGGIRHDSGKIRCTLKIEAQGGGSTSTTPFTLLLYSLCHSNCCQLGAGSLLAMRDREQRLSCTVLRGPANH